MKEPTARMGLNSNVLKLIAILAMTLDHTVWLIFPGYPVEPLPLILHAMGRLTAPIMCYFVAEGYHYTRNVNKYTARLFLFALISHFAYVFWSPHFVDAWSFIPFYYGNVLDQTGVLWSLAWGLVMLRVADSPRIPDWGKIALTLVICVIALPANWSCVGSLCVMAFGTNRGKFKTQMLWMLFYVVLYAIVYAIFIDPVYGALQMCVALSIPLLRLYNGQRGKNPTINKWLKWLFYLYYPIHLVVLGIVGMLL